MRSVFKHSRSFLAARSAQQLVQQLSKNAGVNTKINRSYAQQTPVTPPHPSESFASGSNSVYLDQMYQTWEKDPSAVHPSWNAFFTNLNAGCKPGEACQVPPSIMPSIAQAFPNLPLTGAGVDKKTLQDHLKVLMLIRAYQVRGHSISNLDPLNLDDADLDSSIPETLNLEFYGFTEADLDREFHLGLTGSIGFINTPKITLRDLYNKLRLTYCGQIGYEYMHIRSNEHCDWLRSQIETGNTFSASWTKEDRMKIFDNLAKADLLEKFLAVKYSNQKRFGLDGGESLIPGMEALIDTAVQLGVESIIVGMPHRGRLNVLCNVVKKPLESILSEFQGTSTQEHGSGDVKYHLGMSYTRQASNGKPVTLSLVANPSHLEAVDPLVEGKVRARQFYSGDEKRERVLSVLLHGDAAFAGQGVVYETMGLSDLHNYTTGGTIHIIVNNQIGFTTNPRQARSSPYCSDVAKAFEAPIFHVNGDNPEAVVHVCNLAIQWRQKFHKDVVIDIVCYRRFGHNEQDEPFFTQPIMYKKIATHPSTLNIYTNQVVNEGVMTAEAANNKKETIQTEFESAFERSKTYQGKTSEWLSSKWTGFKSPAQMSRIMNTGVPVELLQQVGKALYTYPSDFNIHPGLAKQIRGKKQMFESGEGFDFATAEALAFGTLLVEGNHVRLSGQDVERGTFSHRHAVLFDQEVKDRSYVPLNNIDPKQKPFTVCNSHLSEFAVLGFEVGFSLEDPHALVCWEAQFGDFANGAQVIIDQFICSGEKKWLRQSGIVMLLPHGYEGNGPEHSSARLERFLQMTDEDPDVIPVMDMENRKQIQENNWQVVNCTTPANYYHVLRRQVHRSFRKPLIVMSPKSLLRFKPALSRLEDMGEGTRFQRLIPETSSDLVDDASIRRVVFCSGKVYYDLVKYRETHKIKDVAVVRIEQLSPFPFDRVAEQAKKYSKAEIVWCQEEPKNMGAWTHFFFRCVTALKPVNGARPRYVGRPTSASTATGFPRVHEMELASFLKDAFA